MRVVGANRCKVVSLKLSILFTAIVALPCALIGCSSLEGQPLTYLALGDSYTIGESVAERERWPVQLASRLRKGGLDVADPAIIARTGWRTDELYEAALSDERVGKGAFDLVSLLIGVNDQYQGRNIGDYPQEFERLIEIAIASGARGKASVFVLSIPDWGVTPCGREKAETVRAEINAYNAIAKGVCDAYGIPFYDITEISRRALEDSSLLASDDLHPSGAMYRLWAEMIVADVRERVR